MPPLLDQLDAQPAKSINLALNLLALQTLMDEEKRADYDSLIGFSHLAVNPFQDSSFEADQVCQTGLLCFASLQHT